MKIEAFGNAIASKNLGEVRKLAGEGKQVFDTIKGLVHGLETLVKNIDKLI